MDTSFRIATTPNVLTGTVKTVVGEAAQPLATPSDAVTVSSTPVIDAPKPLQGPTVQTLGEKGIEVQQRVGQSLIPGGGAHAPGLMHTRMMVIDDKPTLVGSFNFTESYGVRDEDAPKMGVMFGALLGSGTYPVGLTERLRDATNAMQRLQGLEGGYTQQHMARAGNLAMKMGAELDLSPEQAFALAHASMVYDVGKLEVDEKLLSKPGKLTDEERAAVNKHVEPSEDLLSLFNPSPETRGIIRHHHERWDGKGFPDGLAGDKIPLTARMISITDSWDAMTCDRPFRPAMSYDKARGIIEGAAGTQYDPALVKLFFDKVAVKG